MSLTESAGLAENQPASPVQDLIASLDGAFRKNQILQSGSEYELYAKDPAVNARQPDAFIFPESREQVQTLVRQAARHHVKLWVYSTGKNWGYLNTSGSEADSVAVILNRMNKITLVDEELAYAIIEPGVTYEALSRYLLENNYALWTDSPGGPPTGSVIGNALDRGVGVTKYGDHFAHLCGYEVVLADGSVIHTGVASQEGGKGAAHLYKWGVGPYVEGLFSQSNYGIVIQAGIWLMRKPEDYAIFSLNIPDDAALAKCMDAVRELMLAGVIPETGRFSNSVAILTLLTQAIDEGVDSKKAVTRAQIETLKRKYHVPDWTGSFGIYGKAPVVKAARLYARKALLASQGCARVNVFTKERAQFIREKIESIEKMESGLLLKIIDFMARRVFGSSLALLRLFPGLIDLHEGRPVETVVRRGYFRYPKKRPTKDIHVGRDDLGILWSVPVLPFRGSEVVAFTHQCEQLFNQYNFDFYMTTMIFNARSVCPLMVILYDRLDEAEGARAAALYGAILDLSHHMGYQHFRAGINGWEKLYQKCPELKVLNEKIKAALDPEGVLSPGRYGIE
jgi:4-cresol dehydrogenase (hydroxylating)